MEAGGGGNVLHGLLVSLPLGIRSSISARVVPAHRGPLLLRTCKEPALHLGGRGRGAFAPVVLGRGAPAQPLRIPGVPDRHIACSIHCLWVL